MRLQTALQRLKVRFGELGFELGGTLLAVFQTGVVGNHICQQQDWEIRTCNIVKGTGAQIPFQKRPRNVQAMSFVVPDGRTPAASGRIPCAVRGRGSYGNVSRRKSKATDQIKR